jgi:hypothetical protein
MRHASTMSAASCLSVRLTLLLLAAPFAFMIGREIVLSVHCCSAHIVTTFMIPLQFSSFQTALVTWLKSRLTPLAVLCVLILLVEASAVVSSFCATGVCAALVHHPR